MALVVDPQTPQRERRTIRARVVLGYALSYALDVALLALFALANTIPMWVAIAYGAAGATLCSVFYCLMITGFSERFSDRFLTIYQTFASGAVMLIFLALVPNVGFLFLSILFIALKVMADSLKRALKDDTYRGAISLGIFGSMAAFLIHGTVEYFFWELKSQ